MIFYVWLDDHPVTLPFARFLLPLRTEFTPTRSGRRRSPRAARGVPLFCKPSNLPTFQPINPPTFLQPIPFRITSFADPHPLTLIESHLYRKQGRGWVPGHLAPTQALNPCVTHDNARKPNIFIHLLHNSLDTPGVGRLPLSSARLCALCVSALSSSAIRFATLPEAGRPQ